MSKKNSSSLKVKLKIQINNLITIYEQKAECGIFFKLEPEKSPLEILGVLNFLKDRIKKWGNTNFFSYHGDLFSTGVVLVVGARELEEAISIIIYMILSNFVDNDSEIDKLIELSESSLDIENYLRNEVSNNMEIGYPSNPKMELEITKHLEGIVYEQDDNKLDMP
ncbi:MAG: hypothetical protein ACFE9C_00585 [Candidatus Hodarchaeota archaeon]